MVSRVVERGLALALDFRDRLPESVEWRVVRRVEHLFERLPGASLLAGRVPVAVGGGIRPEEVSGLGIRLLEGDPVEAARSITA